MTKKAAEVKALDASASSAKKPLDASEIVWGDKAIIEEIAKVLGWKPSPAWYWKWSQPKHPNRLPIRKLRGSSQRCVVVSELVAWRDKNLILVGEK